jgi:hypothetical protein
MQPARNFFPESSDTLDSLLSTDLAGRPTGYVSSFRQVIEAMERSGMDYAITGRLALCVFAEPGFTDRIDILCREGMAADVVELLPPARIVINIVQANSPPDCHALGMPLRVDVFGMIARFIRPEYLLWQCLLGDDDQSSANAIALIQSGVIEIHSFCDLLVQHAAWQSLARLNQKLMRANMQKSYSESVALRLFRRTCSSKDR